MRRISHTRYVARALLAILAMIGGKTASAQSESGVPQEILRSLNQVVLIGDYDEPKGTGFLITRNGHVLTAAHVLDRNPTEISLYFRNEQTRRSARVVNVNRHLDLALLKITAASLKPPFVFSENILMGEQLWLIGHEVNAGRVERFKLRFTSVQGFNAFDDIEIAANVFPGFSGGPALNLNGEVVGIIQRNDITGKSYILPTREILYFLAGLNLVIAGIPDRRSQNREIEKLSASVADLKKQLEGAKKPTAAGHVSPAVSRVATPGQPPPFENSFLRASVISFKAVEDETYLILTLIFENINKEDITVSFQRDEIDRREVIYNKTLFDEKGGVWIVTKSVGIKTMPVASRHRGSLLTPGHKTPVLLTFKPLGRSDGTVFKFGANLFATIRTEERSKPFSFSIDIEQIRLGY